MRTLGLVFLLALGSLVAVQTGCATSPDLPPAARSGLVEIRSSLSGAEDSVNAVADTLEKMEAMRGDSGALISEYQARVAAMERSLETTRSRLSNVRGPDNFFAAWKASIANISDTELRREGEDRYAAVRDDLDTLNRKIDELRASFAPMHKNMLDLAQYLKDDPTLSALERSGTTIRRILGQHREVRAKLADVQRTLTSLI